MPPDADKGFTPENVFKALLTLKEATEMGKAKGYPLYFTTEKEE